MLRIVITAMLHMEFFDTKTKNHALFVFEAESFIIILLLAEICKSSKLSLHFFFFERQS